MQKALKRALVTIALLAIHPLAAGSKDSRPTREDVERTIPTCSGDIECKARWDAAQRWVLKNMEMKIQTITDVFFETAGPRRQSARARVVKEPGEGRLYKIVLSITCLDIIGAETDRGCFPDAIKAGMSFNEYVGAAPCPDCPQRPAATPKSE